MGLRPFWLTRGKDLWAGTLFIGETKPEQFGKNGCPIVETKWSVPLSLFGTQSLRAGESKQCRSVRFE